MHVAIQIIQHNNDKKKRIVIIGAGFGGLRFLYDVKKEMGKKFEITLIDMRTTSLEKVAEMLKSIEGKSVIFEDGTQLPSDLTLVIPEWNRYLLRKTR